MKVDRISLECSIDYFDLLAMNYATIRNNVAQFVHNKYNEEYNYGVEYYYDYIVVNLHENPWESGKRVIIILEIYKDEAMAELQKESEERLIGGM